ncbi:hypothetical protein YC2023_050114 [Brassica napus]
MEGMNGHKLDGLYEQGTVSLKRWRWRAWWRRWLEAVVVVEEAVVDTEVEDVRVDTVLLERGRGGGWGYEGGEGGGYEGSLGVGVWKLDSGVEIVTIVLFGL